MTTPMPTEAEERLARFPWPFPAEHNDDSAQVEPARRPAVLHAGARGDRLVDLDADYVPDVLARRDVLAADPSRYQVLRHMVPAAWDAMLTLMRELAATYPQAMALRRLPDGSWLWRNDVLGFHQRFMLGDEESLPCPPLLYIGQQLQDDILLLDQRDGALWADAGLVTFAADWSRSFDVGRSFTEIHEQMSGADKEGVAALAGQLLMRLPPGEPYRRTDWTLDASTDMYRLWGPDGLTAADLGRRLHLRVETEHVLRLSDSGCILVLVRTYLLTLQELARMPAWRVRLAAVLEGLPDSIADHKGLGGLRHKAVEWLRAA